jgi:hypothetical protein
MNDELLADADDVAALHAMKRGLGAIVDEIQRVREAPAIKDRTAKLVALQKEFDRRVDELRTYVQLLDVPVAEEERET